MLDMGQALLLVNEFYLIIFTTLWWKYIIILVAQMEKQWGTEVMKLSQVAEST